MGTDSGRVIIL